MMSLPSEKFRLRFGMLNSVEEGESCTRIADTTCFDNNISLGERVIAGHRKAILIVSLVSSTLLVLTGVLLALTNAKELRTSSNATSHLQEQAVYGNREDSSSSGSSCSCRGADNPGNSGNLSIMNGETPVPHGGFYSLSTTRARLEYLDSLAAGDEPSTSTFLWDMILNRQSSPVSVRALEVALKIAANREKPEDLATVFSRAFEAPASEIRRRALALVETYPEPLIVPYLGEIIDLPREEAPLALIALARIGNFQARDKLLEVAKNAKAAKDLRIRAIILVGASKDKFARSTLDSIAREGDEELRKAAEQALRELSK